MAELARARWLELGMQPYTETWQSMRDFTQQRSSDTIDQFWSLQHQPVYTQGQAGCPEHIRTRLPHPLVQTDRGGQVTYHGPGQLIIYCLLDLRRLGIGIKTIVHELEATVIDLLANYDLKGEQQSGAPGVYVAGAKIAALGLRVRRGCCYHGLALNIAMNLSPFAAINPCGYAGLRVTQIRDWIPDIQFSSIETEMRAHLSQRLGYTNPIGCSDTSR